MLKGSLSVVGSGTDLGRALGSEEVAATDWQSPGVGSWVETEALQRPLPPQAVPAGQRPWGLWDSPTCLAGPELVPSRLDLPVGTKKSGLGADPTGRVLT